MRMRSSKEDNYASFFDNGKTIRFVHDRTKGIAPLRYPEIEDVSFTNKCLANCNFCYTSALKGGTYYPNLVEKINDYYGSLPPDKRPWQIAAGGEGEPTMHPDFIKALEALHNLQIMPNYTTNGMHVTEELLEATKKYSGGVAVSCHPHLDKIWRKATQRYVNAGVRTCLHIIVGEPGSAARFWDIYDDVKGIAYYVALPYQVAGRAKDIETESEWGEFFGELNRRQVTDVSFGALFYPYFQKYPELIKSCNIDIYEPEVLSGYRIFDDSYKLLRKSSYDTSPKFKDI